MFPYKNVENLEPLHDSTQIWFDVIAITETLIFLNKILTYWTRILKNKFLVTNINWIKYSYKYCPTASSEGGTMLHIENDLS